MSDCLSFIETQFPVSKMSKESYKERKSSQGQTLTGLGKWWGRKPLVLVRAAILGALLPASQDPEKDMEIFLRIMSMDPEGLLLRKDKNFTVPQLYKIISSQRNLRERYEKWFELVGDTLYLLKDAPRKRMEWDAFKTLGQDDKLAMCIRPEQLDNLSAGSWAEVNRHLGTSASNLADLIRQLSIKRYGRNVKVGDCFCGGGSIPFEAARIGCDTYASDLNPIAGLLTWSGRNICGLKESEIKKIKKFLIDIYNDVCRDVAAMGIETNEKGETALTYLYCNEVKCPECGAVVPMMPSLVVGKRAQRVIADLEIQNKTVNIHIKSNVSPEELSRAKASGTVGTRGLLCPCCGKSTPIATLRHDTVDEHGNIIYGLRHLKGNEYHYGPDDTYGERLVAIRYVTKEGERYYREPNKRDLENEAKVKEIVKQSFQEWQEKGYIPNLAIEGGYNTDQMVREKGWTYWHQMFSERSLIVLSQLMKKLSACEDRTLLAAGLLGFNKCADFSSKLCRLDPSTDKVAQTFYNQAFNTLLSWGVRSTRMLHTAWDYHITRVDFGGSLNLKICDARDVSDHADIWITDPPYADAVNYHELSEFFLAWDRPVLRKAFPDWYTDSKRVLAVRGDEHFSQTMIEIYSNMTRHMNDAGMQIVMFTHSDPAVWAQLAIIMWKAGLKVTAAWNIATETEAVGLKSGNYVKGTVLLVLRKQTDDDMAFLDEINLDIRNEVKNQIETMQKLDDKEEPNFSDPDYVLAAYAASLKVLTSYANIEDLDLDFELNQAISNPSGSKIVAVIESAKKIAYDCVIPLEFDSFLWRELSNAEKFYIKALESEKHGNYQISTYQEFARGFSIGGYSQMMASEKANTARLKTPYEMAERTISDVPDFERSLMRTVFGGIYAGIKADHNPAKALGYIKNEWSSYWDKREMIQQILSFLIDIQDISNMQQHWMDSAKMAELLLASVTHDSI